MSMYYIGIFQKAKAPPLMRLSNLNLRRIQTIAKDPSPVVSTTPLPSSTLLILSKAIHTQKPRYSSSYQLSQYTSEKLSTPPPPPVTGPDNISDDEWNLRAGRVVHTLRITLPSFFENGLVPYLDQDADSSELPRPLTPRTEARKERSRSPRHSESIYAPNIRLTYTPPAALSLPSPFPKSLQVEGLPLYHASAAFIRHTLSAFNTGLQVDMCKLHVRPTGLRQHQISFRTIVSGKSRISGSQNEWDIHSTYTLSPQTALVDLHVVESIHPAPHITFYDGLRAALARLAGVNVARQASDGMQGCVSDRKLARVPVREE